jgi:aminoglycoside phosphotransferase (APT) family kinase protein
VNKGWSTDRKYYIETENGEDLLLRLADIEALSGKEKEFGFIKLCFGTGIRMSAPVGFGVCCGGKSVYTLLTWVKGDDLEAVLPRLPEYEQYRLGLCAGEILRKIHAIPLRGADIPSETKKPKKLRQLSSYEASSVRVPGDEPVIRFVRENIDSIWLEKPAYLHGDFHPGNLVFSGDGIGVIDFNRWEIGDPYEEFYKLESFGREVSVPFARGQIDAYFGGEVPEGFWKALAVYSAHASLYSIKWAERFGRDEIEGMVRRYYTAMEDFEGFTRIVPKWYSGALPAFSRSH